MRPRRPASWFERDNARRAALIAKSLQEPLGIAEIDELAILTERLDREIARVWPGGRPLSSPEEREPYDFDEPLESAAVQFTRALVSRADMHDGSGAPLWHGWALRDAFVAGAAFQRERCSEETG